MAYACDVIRLFDTDTGEETANLKTERYTCKALAFLDGERLISGHGNPPGLHDDAGRTGQVCIWDVKKRKCVRTLGERDDEVFCLAISADGKLFASAGRDDSIWLRDSSTGRGQRALKGRWEDTTYLAFLPDNRLLSFHDIEILRVWSTKTGKELHAWNTAEMDLYSVAVSRDGTLMATGDSWGQVLLWNLAEVFP